MKNKLLVILGSTSTGKTDLALELAKKLNGELISADSRQVYKYLNVGTGKMPGNESGIMSYELGEGFWVIDGIKIHLYDLVGPDKRFNLFEYVLKAGELINETGNLGKLPILVGGTGLYIRSLLEGISEFGKSEDAQLRGELEQLNILQIKQRINQSDPTVLKDLNNSELNNKRRLIRIYEKLNTPKNEKSFPGIEKDFDVLKIGLKADRRILREKIEQRLLKRIDQGLIKESKDLLAKGILTYERMETLGLEYKYIAKYLKGEIKTLEELIEMLSLKIGQFAKRQETWFKKEKNVVWFDVTDKNFIQQVEKRILDWYNDPR